MRDMTLRGHRLYMKRLRETLGRVRHSLPEGTSAVEIIKSTMALLNQGADTRDKVVKLMQSGKKYRMIGAVRERLILDMLNLDLADWLALTNIPVNSGERLASLALDPTVSMGQAVVQFYALQAALENVLSAVDRLSKGLWANYTATESNGLLHLYEAVDEGRTILGTIAKGGTK